jgi:acetyltransferase-like isoleucine patch superfamily enzyme
MIKLIKNLIRRKAKSTHSFPKSDTIRVDSTFQIGEYRNILLENGANVNIESGVIVRNFCNILVYRKGGLKIGKNVFLNNYCSINCLSSIEIGQNTLLGEGVKIYDHNHLYRFDEGVLNIERNEFKTAPIKIGSNCWIASNVTILKGVKIGDNSIIGANNLIYKSIPSNSVIKANTTFDLISHHA